MAGVDGLRKVIWHYSDENKTRININGSGANLRRQLGPG